MKGKKTAHDLHSPTELLGVAGDLLQRGDPYSLRGVVLESFAALESWVSSKVFERLEHLAPKTIVDVLRKRTRNNLDDRIASLVPAAMGRPIDPQSTLWTEYKKARKIRHSVIHEGRRVKMAEAEQVFNAVLTLLSHIESDVGLAVALARLKTFIESAGEKIESEAEAVKIVFDFFHGAPFETAATFAHLERQDPRIVAKADLFFTFENRTVGAETKLLKGAVESVVPIVERSLTQIGEYLARPVSVFDGWALIVFSESELPSRFDGVQRFTEYSTTMVGIHLKTIEAEGSEHT